MAQAAAVDDTEDMTLRISFKRIGMDTSKAMMH